MLKDIQKAQKGHAKAFLKLFQTYELDIYRIAFIYLKNKNDALDVVQETAYQSFKKIKQLREPKYFKTWLVRIAINCSLDLLRRKQKIVHLHPEFENHLTEPMDDNTDLQMTLHDLIEKLNENEKSVVLLRFYEDLSFKEISETLDIPLGTAKTILYRALRKLRKNLKGDDLHESDNPSGNEKN